ncbi:hypothetical protein B0H17DRAFT_1207450 [Mycena rosella]|uniref:Uncharacterized protein n=1 Tax=Mycena rosella TaxID=1033263 RepID=A0AAD7D3A6_MYCRO|nr:hypothetical protein B0H17DRAFT_1207450 [Mycena rosella]
MRLLARFFGLTGVYLLAALAPVFLSPLPVSAAVLASRELNSSLISPACTPTCNPALSAQSTCGADFHCLCTNTNGNKFAQCIDCVVGSAPEGSLVYSAMQGVLSDYTRDCAQNDFPISSLTLSPSATPSPTGKNGKTNGATAVNPPRSVVLGFAALVLLEAVL